MDKETRHKHYRVVGALQTLQNVAKYANGMPCDAATEALLVIACHAIDQAVLSAWGYAEDRTRATSSASTNEENQ